MELYETESPVEDYLRAKADALRYPLGGGFELLPLCNMNCNMCYVRHNVSELEQPLLTKEEWLHIAQEAKEAGVLFLLITGGEPLLYPEFRALYLALREMGFILTVNTNATLIDEEWADFFAENPCRRLNVTLYGASNETYDRLCHNPKGFTQTVNAVRLLLERNVMLRLNFTLTRENRNDLEDMVKLARELEVPFVPASYLFPPGMRSNENERFYQSRMSPREAAETRLKATILRNPGTTLEEQARLLLKQMETPHGNVVMNQGFTCSAARSGFWVNWQGNLTACGMLETPSVDLRQSDFLSAWREIVAEVQSLSNCDECNRCPKKFFCQSCAASCLGECGDIHRKPQYLCDITDAMLDILLEQLPAEERAEHVRQLEDILNAR
ncbi:MAG: radical SAM protein [Clostridiales bacterium]|nr:radical SAM protein [Clostridiales bacterium]